MLEKGLGSAARVVICARQGVVKKADIARYGGEARCLPMLQLSEEAHALSGSIAQRRSKRSDSPEVVDGRGIVRIPVNIIIQASCHVRSILAPSLERQHQSKHTFPVGTLRGRLTNILTLSLSATAFATTVQAALKSSTPPWYVPSVVYQLYM